MSPTDVSGAGRTNNLRGRSRPSPRVEKEALGDSWGPHLCSKGAASWGQPPSVLTQVCSATLGGVGAQSEAPPTKGMLSMGVTKHPRSGKPQGRTGSGPSGLLSFVPPPSQLTVLLSQANIKVGLHSLSLPRWQGGLRWPSLDSHLPGPLPWAGWKVSMCACFFFLPVP